MSDKAGLGLDDVLSYTEIVENNGAYEFSIIYYNATILRCISRIGAYGEAACAGIETLFKEDSDATKICRLFCDNFADITSGHRLVNTYAITQNKMS